MEGDKGVKVSTQRIEEGSMVDKSSFCVVVGSHTSENSRVRNVEGVIYQSGNIPSHPIVTNILGAKGEKL